MKSSIDQKERRPKLNQAFFQHPSATSYSPTRSFENYHRRTRAKLSVQMAMLNTNSLLELLCTSIRLGLIDVEDLIGLPACVFIAFGSSVHPALT